MRVYPVLDLKGGVVVRGIAGERHRYRPVASGLVASSDPLAVARAFRRELGLAALYLADLDAIEGGEPDRSAYEALAGDGFHLAVDRGVRSVEDALETRDHALLGTVAALETLPGPGVLADVVATLGAREAVFSLDLRGGTPLGEPHAWPADAGGVLRLALEAGVERLLVLDLAAVGVGGGPRHLEALRRWRRELPSVELLTGGGVRSLADLYLLRDAGIDGVLVASALHDGGIRPGELRAFGAD